MQSISLETLKLWRASTQAPLVLYGAGDLGKIALHALGTAGIAVNAFCDSSAPKQGTVYRGVPIISPEQLAGYSPATLFLVSNNYLGAVGKRLLDLEFSQFYNCSELFSDVDFDNAGLDVHPLEIHRKIAWHQRECARHSLVSPSVVLKYIDLVITEACSMKCVDCSNLMQYYKMPKNSDLDTLFAALDGIMAAADWVDEIRVLGGEPLINKQFPAIIERIKSYPNFRHIIVYTNGTIVPNTDALKVLADNRVTMNITDYGKHSRRLPDLVAALVDNAIDYLVKVPEWTDSGRIRYVERSPEKLQFQFDNCCVNDIITLLNGKLYRCPFSANATNLGAVPAVPGEYVDVTNETGMPQLRSQIQRLRDRDAYLTACAYCNGRDFRTAKIEAGIQVAKPLDLP